MINKHPWRLQANSLKGIFTVNVCCCISKIWCYSKEALKALEIFGG